MNKTQIKKGLNTIAAADPHINKALQQYGYPKPRLRTQGFATFLETIVSQQISTKAAASIWQRVQALLPEMNAEQLLALPNGALRNAGMSSRKVEYAQGLAQAIVTGDFNPDTLNKMNDEDAITSITQLRGFGRWSAEIYLMFSLKRKDIFPADDLILLSSLQKIKRKRNKLTPKKARDLIQHWSPWRSAGSLFLWHYHHNQPQK